MRSRAEVQLVNQPAVCGILLTILELFGFDTEALEFSVWEFAYDKRHKE